MTAAQTAPYSSAAAPNVLYYGDNLDILRHHVGAATVDLVYLDPPFNSRRTYNVLFREKSGEASPAQIEAFTDTWQWDRAAEHTYDALTAEAPPHVAQMISALRQFVGANDMMAYLVMMAARLVELHRALKPMGSLYLHCDPTVSHYLKAMLDTVFGVRNYRNEITWQRTNVHSDSHHWSDVSDRILYYVKDFRAPFTWNPPRTSHSDAYIASKYRQVDPDGRRYQLDNMTSPNPRPNMMYEWKGHASPAMGWRYSKETMARLDAEGRIWYPPSKEQRPRLKRYLDEQEGRLLGDVWTDIDPINSQAKERLGYPTQKPLSLLERIIAASSNPGDVVLDPFCGCGTAVVAAQKLGRRWIGIDITHLAISLMRYRLTDAFPDAAFDVRGVPVDVGGARALAESNRYQFQWWALPLVHAQPLEGKEQKGADRGIDGVITFVDDRTGKLKRALVQVKSGGHISSATVRDLVGTLHREKAELALLLTLDPPTGPMRSEAAQAGFYRSPGWQRDYPRVQILTVADLLDGKQPNLPPGRMTYERAERIAAPTHRQAALGAPPPPPGDGA